MSYLSSEEIAAWKAQETTKKVVERIQESLDAAVAHIMSGGVLGDTSDETARNVARLTGRIEGLTFILEMEGDEDE